MSDVWGKDCISLSVSEGDVSDHFPPLSVDGVCEALFKIRYIKHWSHFLRHDIHWSHDKTSKDGCFSSCMQLEKCLLTGWSWSKSGSNLVTRWWHLSKSAIFFGNQWTRAEKRTKTNGWIQLSAVFCDYFSKNVFVIQFRGGYIWLLWWF